MAGHVVTGAAVVLKLRGGNERYLYRGAPIPDGVYKAESIRHAESVGLVAAVPDPEPTAPAAPTEPAASTAAAAPAATSSTATGSEKPTDKAPAKPDSSK